MAWKEGNLSNEHLVALEWSLYQLLLFVWEFLPANPTSRNLCWTEGGSNWHGAFSSSQTSAVQAMQYSCWRHPRAPGSFVGFTGVQGSRLWCWSSLWMIEKMMLLVSRVCFMWHYKQVFWGFWGVMLTFVADAREDDVVGVTRLLHVVIGFLGGSGVWCWSSLWMLEKMMLLVSRVCFMW